MGFTSLSVPVRPLLWHEAIAAKCEYTYCPWLGTKKTLWCKDTLWPKGAIVEACSFLLPEAHKKAAKAMIGQSPACKSCNEGVDCIGLVVDTLKFGNAELCGAKPST